MNTLRCISGITLFITSLTLFYYRFDVVTSLFQGKTAFLEELIVPVFLFVFGIFMMFKKRDENQEQFDL